MKTKHLWIFLLSACFFSCQKEKELGERTATTGIVFGTVSGECNNDCQVLYLLTDEGIYEEAYNVSWHEWRETRFKNKPLPETQFAKAKGLLDRPVALRDGTLDAGYFLHTYLDVDYRFEDIDLGNTWAFDTIADEAPPEIKDYFAQMVNIFRELNQ